MWPSLWLLSCFLVVLAWKLSSLTQKDVPLVNFDESVYFSHEHLQSPSTKEEILDLVQSAARNNLKIKVLGSGHSRSAIAQSDGVFISLHNFTGIVGVDLQKKRVTVRTGTMLRTVNGYLDEYGLALSNLPAVADQSIGGAISIGTHGTGLSHGNLASMITSLELISGNGEIITASADENPEIFKAAQVSIGMLGVITEVTFQCVDKFNLEETLKVHSLDYCLENFHKLASSADHVKLWMEVYSGTCAAFLVNRTTEQERDIPNLYLLNLKWKILESFIWIASWVPIVTRPIMQLLFGYCGFFQPHNFVDTSFSVLVPQHYFPVNHQTEYIVEYSDCPDAIAELMRLVAESEAPVNLVSEVRLVKADDIWLSPAYQRDSCHMTLMMYNPSNYYMQQYFDGYYNAIRRLHPRVHWGKYFQLTHSEVADLYPRLRDFAAVRAQLDPKGLFLNELLENLFQFSS